MSPFQSQTMNPVQKVLASLLGLATLVLGFMFSIVVIPAILILALLGFGYFWWKTRVLRKAMAGAMAQARTDADVIEGEAVVVREERDLRHLPDRRS